MLESELVRRVLKDDAEAIRFFNILAQCSQQMDDVVDGDKLVTRADLQCLFWNLLVTLPSMPFYQTYQAQLIPVMMMVLNDWFVANELEDRARLLANVKDLHISHLLRDSLAMLLCQLAFIVGGPDWMNQVSVDIRLHVHDELFTDYVESL